MSSAGSARRGRLRVLGRLDRYVAVLFLRFHLVTSLCVIGLLEVLELATNIDDYTPPTGDGTGLAHAALIVRYLALQTPFLFFQVAPFVTLFAGLFALAHLMRSNEWIAVTGGGISMQRMLLPFLVCSALVSGVGVLLRDVVCESLGQDRDRVRNLLRNEGGDVVAEDLWFRDRRGFAIHADRYVHGDSSGASSRIEGLRFGWSGEEGWKVVLAEQAVFSPMSDGGGAWLLTGGRQERSDGAARWSQELERVGAEAFSPEDAFLSWKAREHPQELSLGEARALSERYPSDVRFLTLFHCYLAYPLANLTLLLLGLPLVLVDIRAPWRGVLLGFAVSLVFFSLESVLRSLGMEGRVGPLMAGWTPQLFLGSLGIVLFASMRT